MFVIELKKTPMKCVIRVRHVLMTQHMRVILKVLSRMVRSKALPALCPTPPPPVSTQLHRWACVHVLLHTSMVLHGSPLVMAFLPLTDWLVRKSTQ